MEKGPPEKEGIYHLYTPTYAAIAGGKKKEKNSLRTGGDDADQGEKKPMNYGRFEWAALV